MTQLGTEAVCAAGIGDKSAALTGTSNVNTHTARLFYTDCMCTL